MYFIANFLVFSIVIQSYHLFHIHLIPKPDHHFERLNEGIPPPNSIAKNEWEPTPSLLPPPPKPPRSPLPSLPDLIILSAAAGLATALRIFRRLNQEERRSQELEAEYLRSELGYLKLQLSPHFLFNTLNNIYALIDLDQEKSQKSVLDLSRLLRYLLYECSAQRVPLQGEINFIHSFIALMNLRLPIHVNTKFDFDIQIENRLIAPLLFLPLIENAFKHGVDSQESSEIEFQLWEEEGGIAFSARNRAFPKNENDRSGSGLGLVNLSKRLQLEYPDRHQLQTKTDNQIYEAHLWIAKEKL